MTPERLAELRQEYDVMLSLAAYRPGDQETHLGPRPWDRDDPTVQAWEAAHGHHVQSKCYPEYQCRVIEAAAGRDVHELCDEVERLQDLLDRGSRQQRGDVDVIDHDLTDVYGFSAIYGGGLAAVADSLGGGTTIVYHPAGDHQELVDAIAAYIREQAADLADAIVDNLRDDLRDDLDEEEDDDDG